LLLLLLAAASGRPSNIAMPVKQTASKGAGWVGIIGMEINRDYSAGDAQLDNEATQL